MTLPENKTNSTPNLHLYPCIQCHSYPYPYPDPTPNSVLVLVLIRCPNPYFRSSTGENLPENKLINYCYSCEGTHNVILGVCDSTLNLTLTLTLALTLALTLIGNKTLAIYTTALRKCGHMKYVPPLGPYHLMQICGTGGA